MDRRGRSRLSLFGQIRSWGFLVMAVRRGNPITGLPDTIGKQQSIAEKDPPAAVPRGNAITSLRDTAGVQHIDDVEQIGSKDLETTAVPRGHPDKCLRNTVVVERTDQHHLGAVRRGHPIMCLPDTYQVPRNDDVERHQPTAVPRGHPYPSLRDTVGMHQNGYVEQQMSAVRRGNQITGLPDTDEQQRSNLEKQSRMVTVLRGHGIMCLQDITVKRLATAPRGHLYPSPWGIAGVACIRNLEGSELESC